jgi:hypothetical protein
MLEPLELPAPPAEAVLVWVPVLELVAAVEPEFASAPMVALPEAAAVVPASPAAVCAWDACTANPEALPRASAIRVRRNMMSSFKMREENPLAAMGIPRRPSGGRIDMACKPYAVNVQFAWNQFIRPKLKAPRA